MMVNGSARVNQAGEAPRSCTGAGASAEWMAIAAELCRGDFGD
jgi:hypothetical protein